MHKVFLASIHFKCISFNILYYNGQKKIGQKGSDMLNTIWIEEDQLIQTTLLDLLHQNFYSTSLTPDGDIIVQTDGPHVLFEINPELHTLKLMSLYNFNVDSALTDKLSLMNAMNDNAALVRFAMPPTDPEFLVADYALCYEGGISFHQVLASLHLFTKVIAYAIHTYDCDGIIYRKD